MMQINPERQPNDRLTLTILFDLLLININILRETVVLCQVSITIFLF